MSKSVYYVLVEMGQPKCMKSCIDDVNCTFKSKAV